MAKRNVIRIDEEKCDGCGDCVTSCAEGAISIIEGKARLVSDVYCDGLGACLGHCPQGAITLEEREAADFDEGKTQQHLARLRPSQVNAAPIPVIAPHHECPGSMARSLGDRMPPTAMRGAAFAGSSTSELINWPVQMALV
jgi:Pyruvate/2-oxoacid:ferredoxin oxidoreductase delta subunit